MRSRLLLLVAALAMALAACGGGDTTSTDDSADAPTAAAAGEAVFVGNDSLKWDSPPAEAELVDGELDVTIECDGAVPHNIAFEGVNGGEIVAECSGDDSGTGTVALEPGTYTYFCAIPGHREAGMVGELTVS